MSQVLTSPADLFDLSTDAEGHDLTNLGRVTAVAFVGDGSALTGINASGSVTNVALTLPNIFTVVGSPITSSGTFAVTFATQSANAILAGPTTGSAATPAFRALVAADIPAIAESQVTNLVGDLSTLATAITSRLIAASNLSDLANPATARTNLGLGSAATQASSAFEGAITAGTTLQFWRGDKSFQTLNTSVVPESGNLYYTTARVNTDAPNVTIGTGNGLSLAGQVLSLSVASSGVAGALSGSDKTKLDGIASGATANVGTVTSVDMSVPSILMVAGNPITSSGTLAITLSNQAANTVFTGPTTGTANAPTFRALVNADIPNHDAGKLTSGTVNVNRLPGNVAYVDSGQTFTQQQVFSLLPTLPNQTANTIYAGPGTSPSATPTFRVLVAADIPNIAESQVTNLTTDLAAKAVAARLINTTAPISGGGDLSADRTLSMHVADATHDGYLSSTDWGTFNGKEGAITGGTTGQYWRGDKSFQTLDKTAVGLSNVLNSKQVVSISLTTPSVIYTTPVTFSVDGSGAATATLSLNTQTANTVFAGPSSSPAATPTFRVLAAADIPNIDASKVTSGTFAVARGGTGLSTVAAGKLLYASALDTLAELTLGTNLSITTGTLNASGGGSSLPIDDGTAIVKGSSDATKLVRIEADGLTTGTTRVWTAPDANTTIPVFSQVITFAGPTAARTVTLPDAAFTVARTDAAQTFTGDQTLLGKAVFTNANAYIQATSNGLVYRGDASTAHLFNTGFGTEARISNQSTRQSLTLHAIAADYAGLGINLAASPTSDAIQVTSSGGTGGDLFKVTAAGGLKIAAKFAAGTGSIVYAASVTPNCDSYNRVDIGTLTGNITINDPTGTPANGQILKIKLVQDGTGGRTLTWGSGYVFGTIPATADIVTTASSKQLLVFEYDGTDLKWIFTGIHRR